MKYIVHRNTIKQVVRLLIENGYSARQAWKAAHNMFIQTKQLKIIGRFEHV